MTDSRNESLGVAGVLRADPAAVGAKERAATANLAAQVEANWIALVVQQAGDDASQAVRRQLADLRAKLTVIGGHLESMLVDRVVLGWLQVQRLEQSLLESAGASMTQRRFLQRQRGSAHRRHLSALAALARVQGLPRLVKAGKHGPRSP